MNEFGLTNKEDFKSIEFHKKVLEFLDKFAAQNSLNGLEKIKGIIIEPKSC